VKIWKERVKKLRRENVKIKARVDSKVVGIYYKLATVKPWQLEFFTHSPNNRG
jgi:hypothetical protein